MQDSQSISLIWFCHVPHILESRPTYEWVMSTIWSSHVPHMNMSCLTYECVTSHIWTILSTYEWVMSHVERVMSHIWIKTCPTYERVVSHIWSSRVTHMNQTCPVYEWFVSHICMNYVSHIESCPSHVPQNNESWVYGRIVSPMNESCPICAWILFHTYMWNSFKSHIHHINPNTSIKQHQVDQQYFGIAEWVMSHRFHIWTPSRHAVFRNSHYLPMSHVPRVNVSCSTFERVMSHVWMSQVLHTNQDLSIKQRLVDVQYFGTACPSRASELQVSQKSAVYFRKRALYFGKLLQ